VLAATAALSAGILLLGLPGAVFLEIVDDLGLARKLAPDAVWPLAIVVTVVGAVLIAPLSLAVRHRWPSANGWGHVWRTALLTVAATFLFTLLVAR
jgi:hypothetical protein